MRVILKARKQDLKQEFEAGTSRATIPKTNFYEDRSWSFFWSIPNTGKEVTENGSGRADRLNRRKV